MTAINDLTSYNANMIKGMADKLWFVNHLSKDDRYLFVDFGCADGTLIYILSQMREFPNGCEFIGYDISEEMVGLAKTKYDWGTNNNVSFYSNQEELYKGITAKAPTVRKRVLVLSSVIHEIYSYGTREEINNFWSLVWSLDFEYVFVRDMMCSYDINRPSNESNVEKITEVSAAGKACTLEQLYSFKDEFGSLDNQKNLVHFLLKYRWKINWNREVKENYFPISIECFLEIMQDSFTLDYLERFRVPFLEECWYKDFGIVIPDYTHCKLMFTKRKRQ